MNKILQNYENAKEFYSTIGVDADEALQRLSKFSISVHCWQADDVAGFEKPNSQLSDGGIQVTGNYFGKARSIKELQLDMEKVFSLVPGRHRFNLHAIYGDFEGQKIDRNEIEPKHFNNWIDWARKNNLKLDFNATCFSHPKAESGFTLSNYDKGIRDFWIEHVKRAREITTYFGKEFKSPSVHNLWIPDGSKDLRYDKWKPREILKESLDKIFDIEYEQHLIKDAVESKLFGIGSESYVVGSHEFYLGYALTRNKMICLDMGHFHLSENVADKISSVLQFSNELLFHISRAVRWDSDHIPILNDELIDVCSQIVRYDLDNRTNIALDFFDGSLNRLGAYVLGIRSTLKSLLLALLEPGNTLKKLESQNNYLARLAVMEEMKFHPIGAVWDYYCYKNDVPLENKWLDEVSEFENKILSKRI